MGARAGPELVDEADDEEVPDPQVGVARGRSAPVTFKACMYGAEAEADGAWMTIFLLVLCRVIEMSGNSGLPRARSAEPGVTGTCPSPPRHTTTKWRPGRRCPAR